MSKKSRPQSAVNSKHLVVSCKSFSSKEVCTRLHAETWHCFHTFSPPLLSPLPPLPCFQDLVNHLVSLDTPSLASWARDNRDHITLDLLGYIADKEQMSTTKKYDNEHNRLWTLGSTLMAAREGLEPMNAEQLLEELRLAAEETATQQAESTRVTSTQQNNNKQASSSAFPTVVKQTAELGLSPEGMALLHQQAVALESIVGISRARSLTEVIGRKKIETQKEQQNILNMTAQVDVANRILEVLVGIPDRQERAALLGDAFTPPPGDMVQIKQQDDDDDDDEEEEQVYTSPLRLLQAIDLMLARVDEESYYSGESSGEEYNYGGGTEGTRVVLEELRDDVVKYWEMANNTSSDD